MLITYTENRFPSGYVPTVFENYETFVNFKGKAITFSLWDTAGFLPSLVDDSDDYYCER